MSIEYSNVLIYIIAIILLFFFGRIFIRPLKVVVKLLYSSILGGIVILIINLVGGSFDFNIALNPLTAFTIGTLGLPGIGLTIALKNILNI